ncbi:hypothetical protein Lal_00048601 [Lupinus albus]|nr:hypothetical protein Lal_00048601 [Lupinus albus]
MDSHHCFRYSIRHSHFHFGKLLSPKNFRRKTARPVSYYALFKGLLLLSEPPVFRVCLNKVPVVVAPFKTVLYPYAKRLTAAPQYISGRTS